MNQTLKAALVAIPLTFSLTGCVIIASEDGQPSSWTNSDWKQTQKENCGPWDGR